MIRDIKTDQHKKNNLGKYLKVLTFAILNFLDCLWMWSDCEMSLQIMSESQIIQEDVHNMATHMQNQNIFTPCALLARLPAAGNPRVWVQERFHIINRV